MNRSFEKIKTKRKFINSLFILVLALSSIMMISCGGGGSSASPSGNVPTDDPSNDDPTPTPTPTPTPEPTLGVTINSIETDECPNVKVYVSVADENSQMIDGDPALAVQLYEDGVAQTNNFSIAWQGDTQVPITVVIAMDYSLSMTDSIPDMEAGVKAFIDSMKPTDKASIIKFYYQPQVMIGLTSDKTALYNAVDQNPDSNLYTNIYDTVVAAVDTIAGNEGRIAVVLLTDGEHLVSLDYTVTNTLASAVDRAKQQNVPVYTIGLDLREDSEIEYISEETGGIHYPILNSSIIGDIYLSLFELLEKQHLIVYTTSAADGQEHSIQVSAQYGGVSGESVVQNFITCPVP